MVLRGKKIWKEDLGFSCIVNLGSLLQGNKIPAVLGDVLLNIHT